VDIYRNGYNGIGESKPLKHDLQGGADALMQKTELYTQLIVE